MHTRQHIEEQLTEAAKRMVLVSKAAQDQSARRTGEPVDVPQPPLGDAIASTSAVGKP